MSTYTAAPYLAEKSPKAGDHANNLPYVTTSASKKKKMIGIALIVLGLVIFTVGIVFGTVIPSKLHTALTESATTCTTEDVEKESFLAPHGDCEFCVPFYLDYHPFNIENPMEYLAAASSDKPIKLQVTEIGPYVYRKFPVKINVALSADTLSLQYQVKTTWSYEPTLSCTTCKESDVVTTLNVAYLKVMTASQGEENLMENLVLTILTAKQVPDPADNIELIKMLAPLFFSNFLKALNGINSLDITATARVSKALKPLLETDALGLINAVSSFNDDADAFVGLPFTGLFVTRSVRDLAYGSPSFLAGLATVSVGARDCATLQAKRSQASFADVESLCAKCNPLALSRTCLEDYAQCARCSAAQSVLRVNKALLCPQLKQRYAALLGAKVATTLIASTCDTCSAANPLFCLAPLPGHVEGSGMDWNDPAADALLKAVPTLLKTSAYRTGCESITSLGEYTTFENIQTQPIWKVGHVTNPNSLDLAFFNPICSDPKVQDAQTVCERVSGGAGSSYPPAGSNLNGLRDEAAFKAWSVYVSQARRSVLMSPTGEASTVQGVDLLRHRPSRQLLSAGPTNVNTGIGVPVDGVANLAFASTGFLAYIAFPFFLFGNETLVTNVTLVTKEGVTVTPEYLVTDAAVAAYGTYIDIEPASGKAMNVRNRLMAAYAIGQTGTGAPITDMLNPFVPTEVIIPVYWAQERVTITPAVGDKFSSVASLGRSSLPVFIIGLLVGLGLVGAGLFLYRRSVSSKETSV